MDKASLRKIMIKRLNAFPKKREESMIISKRLTALEEWKEAKTILAFYPLGSEPDITSILADERVLLPYIEDGKMHFSGSRNLRHSSYGVMEPEHIEAEYDDALMIVPMLGFNGLYRLGRGGGYYDRYIAENREKLRLVGVAYSASLCPEFIPEPHDEMLDIIITPEA